MDTSPSSLDYLLLIILRPLLAVSFVVSLILLGWVLAWKLVLVHVPLVREICKSLKKKPAKVKSTTSRRRLSQYYSSKGSNLASTW